MAILYDNEDVKAFLKVWGIDMKLMRAVTIHIPKDDIVTVTVELLTDVDSKKLQDTMIEEYALTKINKD